MSTGILGLLFAMVFWLARSPLLAMHQPHPDVLCIAQALWPILAVWSVFDGVYTVGIGVLRGLGDALWTFGCTTLVYWGVGIPLSYGLGVYAGVGAPGIWWGNLISAALCAVTFTHRFYQRTRRTT